MDGINAVKNPFTGLACIDDCTIAVTGTTHGAILKFIPKWSPGKPWPRAFMRAALTTLLISKFGEAHTKASVESHGQHGLWSLPLETLKLILQEASAPHSAWLQQRSTDGASFYGVPLTALTSTLIQEPLVRLYLAGAWVFDP
jgi:hypothetical protein